MHTQVSAGSNNNGSTYLTIFRVYGSAIHLWPHNRAQPLGKTYSFELNCHDRETPAESPNIQVLVLPEYKMEVDKCNFRRQSDIKAQPLAQSELAIYMTPPASSSKKATYAFDISISKQSDSLNNLDNLDIRKVGTVYLFLDPKFSSQGIQRMQIIGAYSQKPVGQMQVEYLIVRNPIAYGVTTPYYEILSQIGSLDAGHRGSGSGCRADLTGSITENTVASFNYASRHGANMCELDVMCTSDGVPVVYHNYTLDTSKPDSTQIDELTLDELRGLKNLSIHDRNCHHDLNISEDEEHKSSRPFPTLAEVLHDVDESCALNIEFKWPQQLANGKKEAIHYREINDFVDRILECIDRNCKKRLILLSTFNTDIAIMLRLKQKNYPVLFLTTGDSERFNDPATKSVKDAVHFAQAFDLAGVNPNVAHLDKNLVCYAQERKLLVYAWGKIETTQAIIDLKSTGINGLIYDKIDLIKPKN